VTRTRFATGWVPRGAAVGAMCVLGALAAGCGSESTQGATRPDASSVGELPPLVPTELPDGFVLTSISDAGDWGDETGEVIGGVDVDDPFDHPFVLHLIDPAAPPLTVPGGESVDLGGVGGRLFDGSPGEILSNSVLWTDDEGNHSFVGHGIETSTLVELATVAASAEPAALPDGWALVVARSELATSGGALAYTTGSAEGSGWPELAAIVLIWFEGDEQHLQLARVLRQRQVCLVVGAGRCGERVEVRGRPGWLDRWTFDDETVDDSGRPTIRSISHTTLHWLEPGGRVVSVDGIEVDLEVVLEVAESLEETTWDLLRAQLPAGGGAATTVPATTVP
jgi:hypothetical protein